MRKFILSTLPALALVTSLVGCAPRGETRTLEEVLDTARSRYIEQARGEQVEPLKTTLLDLSKSLEVMTAANGAVGQVAPDASKVADTLTTLVRTSGYTSRASMGEIIMQHRVLGSDAAKGEVNSARVKLLVARTYNVPTSELETTKFAVQPLTGPQA